MAARYLLQGHGRRETPGFLRFVMYVAVGGVTVGVAALLLALTIVRGFSQGIEEKIIGFGAHVQVESYEEAPLDDASARRERLRALPGVTAVAPVVQEFALLRRSAQEIDGVSVWGTEVPPAYLEQQLTEGTFDFTPDSLGRPGLVIGGSLARLLGVSVGDRVTAFAMRGDSRGLQPSRPRLKQFHVSGIYETALSDFDEIHVLTSLEVARDLLSYGPEQVSRFDLTLDDIAQVDAVAAQAEDLLGFPVIARTIYQVYRGLFAWIRLQQQIIPLVIGVIVLVGAFNIVGALLMLILEKNREIGILESMGASPRALRRLFLWLGLLIGVIGTTLGGALALALALLQLEYGIIPLPAEAYYMDTAPIELDPLDFVIVGGLTMALCLLAAYLPARVASGIEPIRAIRFR